MRGGRWSPRRSEREEGAAPCPRCRRGRLMRRVFAVTREPYWLCDRYPDCSYWTEELDGTPREEE